MKSYKNLLAGLWAVLLIAPFASAGIIIPTSVSETIVESRTGGLNFANYSEDGGGFPNSWSNSSAKSTAPGTTQTNCPGASCVGSRFNSNSGIGGDTTWFQVNPTLPTAGGTYEVYVTATGSSQGNVTSTITQIGGTGLPPTTTAFSPPGNSWNLVGTLVLNSGLNNPTIRFAETANSNRLYADAVLFAEVQTIPEPGTFALTALACIGLVAGWRKRS